MAEQLLLIEPGGYQPPKRRENAVKTPATGQPAGRANHPNSIAAWHANELRRPTQRGEVYRLVASAGDRGLTRQELTGRHYRTAGGGVVTLTINAVCGRAKELLQMRLIVEDGTREGRSVLKCSHR